MNINEVLCARLNGFMLKGKANESNNDLIYISKFWEPISSVKQLNFDLVLVEYSPGKDYCYRRRFKVFRNK